MKIPIETRPALWGAAGGAAAMAFVGFTWGGWVTAGKAETMVQTRVSEAVVGALAPVCAERFRHTGGAPANLVELKKVAWPTRKETLNYTLMVIGVCVGLAVFIGAVDFGLSKALELIVTKKA